VLLVVTCLNHDCLSNCSVVADEPRKKKKKKRRKRASDMSTTSVPAHVRDDDDGAQTSRSREELPELRAPPPSYMHAALAHGREDEDCEARAVLVTDSAECGSSDTGKAPHNSRDVTDTLQGSDHPQSVLLHEGEPHHHPGAHVHFRNSEETIL